MRMLIKTATATSAIAKPHSVVDVAALLAHVQVVRVVIVLRVWHSVHNSYDRSRSPSVFQIS